MQILMRDGKGGVRMLPQSVVEPLREHLVKVWVLHRQDIADGFGEVYLPYALDRKYPNAGREWAWQHVFPSTMRWIDPCSGVVRRHHADEKVLQRPMKKRYVRPTLLSRPHRILNRSGLRRFQPVCRSVMEVKAT